MKHLSYGISSRGIDGFRVYHLSVHSNVTDSIETDLNAFEEEPSVKPSAWITAASIVPELGNNCYTFKVADGNGWT